MPQIAGIGWFREEQYIDFLEICEKNHCFPYSYEKWIAKSVEQSKDWLHRGMAICKIEVDPAEFKNWCEKSGHSPGKSSLNNFVRRKLAESFEFAGPDSFLIFG